MLLTDDFHTASINHQQINCMAFLQSQSVCTSCLWPCLPGDPCVLSPKALKSFMMQGLQVPPSHCQLQLSRVPLPASPPHPRCTASWVTDISVHCPACTVKHHLRAPPWLLVAGNLGCSWPPACFHSRASAQHFPCCHCSCCLGLRPCCFPCKED